MKLYEARVLMQVSKRVQVKASSVKAAEKKVLNSKYWEDEYIDCEWDDVEDIMEGPYEVKDSAQVGE